MARLYNACGDQTTQLCEAVITVRTIAPTQEETKESGVAPLSRFLFRSQTG